MALLELYSDWSRYKILIQATNLSNIATTPAPPPPSLAFIVNIVRTVVRLVTLLMTHDFIRHDCVHIKTSA